MTRKTENAQRFFFGLFCLLVSFADAAAQEVSSSSVHWAYSSYFGSGWYRVSGDRDVFVLRMTPRWDLRDADFAEDGTRTTGVELSFPITAGLDKIDLDDIAGTTDPDNLASLSVTPGIAITIPLSERWALRPFASVGWGTLEWKAQLGPDQFSDLCGLFTQRWALRGFLATHGGPGV